MSTVLADYKVQRSDFDELCKPVSKKSILFFEGESGCGKTTLLLDCMRHIPDDMKHIAFDCKGRTTSISEFFSRSLQQLGWEGLSEFRNSISSLSKDLTINIHDIKQKGDQNTIDIALRAESEDEKRNRRTILTEAWFRDVRKLDSRLLIIVDTFEQAGSDLIKWFCGPFLARVPDASLMRVLVAGQKTPEHNNIEWGDCCQHHRLLGISDAQEWMPVVEAMGRFIEEDTSKGITPIGWLSGVCHALKGRPDAIIKVIEDLPCKKETV
jgi:hypothetical protein